MIQVIHTPSEMLQWRQKHLGKSIGFVPTMGALHRGHESLMKQCRQQCDLAVLSLFVNPTQFNNPQDLKTYPVTWENDLEMANENHFDVVFAPTAESMYPDQYKYKVIETQDSLLLCGASRPGHFDGVLSVVLKLFQIVQPQKAFFGEKDFQQLSLIQEMVKAFFLPVQIVPMPTVRESDGLAMSSRNVRLSAQERQQAPLIYQTLKSAPSAEIAKKTFEEKGWKVDYVQDWRGRRLAAVHLGAVRLIDNVQI